VRLLHFGPQKEMASAIDRISTVDQVGIDYFADGYVAKYDKNTLFGDVTRLTLFDGFADGVIILHVLEHIPDLAVALKELHRVMKPGAWMMVEVPCNPLGRSKSCLGNITQTQRKACSGQRDHFWYYNCSDFRKRVETAGKFSCHSANALLLRQLTPAAVSKFQFTRFAGMLLCRK
jgi:SAM-dependent methyltransferase